MNYADARQAMIESQLMPNGIMARGILEAFQKIPREMFLPEAYKETCYKDDEIHLPNQRTVIDPITLARLIKYANIARTDVVLCLGDITGYTAAIVSMLASTVIRIESDIHALSFSDNVYQELDVMNIVSINGECCAGDQAHAPFDKIILCGASAKQPTALINQLSPEGCLTYVQKPDPLITGKLCRIIKEKEGRNYIQETIIESAASYSQGFEALKEFTL